MSDREHAEDQGENAHHRLQGHHQLALVDAVGHDAAVRTKDQHGQHLQRDDQAECGARPGQLQHQP